MPREFLVIDLEGTCWDAAAKKENKPETIEIGAVLLSSVTGNVLKEFQSFVRPVRNPELSDFCTRLTTITQDQVDDAPSFPLALERLQTEILDKYTVLFCSWGGYDREQLRRDCKYHKVVYPFKKRHLNVKDLFSKRMRCRPCGMEQALKMLRIELRGTHHRGLDDARNIAEILKRIRA